MENKNEIGYNKKLFYISFFGVYAVLIAYIGGFISVLASVISLLFYSFLAYLIYISWKSLFKKEKMDYINYLNYFLYRISVLFLICFVIVGGFIYYNNEISPAVMPTYTISNGKKTVVFQTMSHIGSEEFYNKVKKNLISKKKEGYVYFFEGVKPGKKENQKRFNKAIGIKFDKDLYKNFSKLYGVVHQNNSIYMNLVNKLDFNVDISVDDIMEKYSVSKISSKPKINLLENEQVIDVNKQIVKTLSELNYKELQILRYLNKGMLNFMIGSEKTQSVMTDNFSNKRLFSIILGARNKVISSEIIKTKYDKIYITYGLLHFKGVFKLLKENDKNWKIVKIEKNFPIK